MTGRNAPEGKKNKKIKGESSAYDGGGIDPPIIPPPLRPWSQRFRHRLARRQKDLPLVCGSGHHTHRGTNSHREPAACDLESGTVSLLLLLLLFLTFSVLVANPKKTTLHGGQSRSWSAEQGKENKRKSLAAYPPSLPPPPHTARSEKNK